MSEATSEFDLQEMLFIAIECIIGILAEVFNSLVVLVIVRTTALHTVTNTFICSLALADISVGLFVTPSSILTTYGIPGNFYGCLLTSCIAIIFTNISIMMLLAIALDRFFAIKEPFLYHKVMSMHRAYFINGGIWLMGLNTGLIPYYGWHRLYKELEFCRFIEVIQYEHLVYLQYFGIILPSMIIMFIAYTYIWVVVWRQMRVIDALNNRFTTASELSLAKKWYSRDVKASKMIVLAVAVFVCRTPLSIMNCVNLFCKTCKYPSGLLMGFILLSHFNSCLNPVVYALSNSAIRRALSNMIQRALCPGEDLLLYLGVRSSLTLEYSSHREIASRSIVSLNADFRRVSVREETIANPSMENSYDSSKIIKEQYEDCTLDKRLSRTT